ncbi:MAG: aldolase catalytic domain-containing protein [Lachnospiraceae bacterium]|nr:aldolase catalytic domain-containing protein [Lachnospiraceae bacterium]
MGEIKLLDCTLRDGGYINDWEFGHDNLVSVFERVTGAGVDVIEIGFLDERRNFDPNRSIMPDTDCVEKIYGRLSRKNTMVVGMIDYGTCGIEHIRPCAESFLDGIRVIFKKHLRKPAIDFCGQIKALGYKVFVQLVSITSYSDEELMDLISLANDLKPYAVSMVDTYGLLHQNNLMHYFDILEKELLPEIGIGYHSHNNFQMAYANCIEMLSHSRERMLLIDGSIYGMGKSAGNAPLELLAMHLNERYGKHYDISQILEAVDANIMPIFRLSPWGYNMFYFIAASNDCHPNYVSYLMDKGTLSIKDVNRILKRIEGEDRLMYNSALIERLYMEYQDIDVDDTEMFESLKILTAGRTILLLGPGLSIMNERDRIQNFLEEQAEAPLIISVNFLPRDLRTDYIFLSNAKRYVQLATALTEVSAPKVIATSNVTKTDGAFDYTLRYSSLIDPEAHGVCRDNSFIMLLKVMLKLSVKEVYLAGFDGYAGSLRENYIYQSMEYHFSDKQAEDTNRYTITALQEIRQQLECHFITDSLYQKTEQQHE